jgi:hypothetical protein
MKTSRDKDKKKKEEGIKLNLDKERTKANNI